MLALLWRITRPTADRFLGLSRAVGGKGGDGIARRYARAAAATAASPTTTAAAAKAATLFSTAMATLRSARYRRPVARSEICPPSAARAAIRQSANGQGGQGGGVGNNGNGGNGGTIKVISRFGVHVTGTLNVSGGSVGAYNATSGDGGNATKVTEGIGGAGGKLGNNGIAGNGGEITIEGVDDVTLDGALLADGGGVGAYIGTGR